MEHQSVTRSGYFLSLVNILATHVHKQMNVILLAGSLNGEYKG